MKHTILFVAANPGDTEPLALDQECTAIEEELRIASSGDDFELISKWTVSVDALMRYLNQLRPAILHFSGHGIRGGTGVTGERSGPRRDVASPVSGGIILQDRDGSQHVSERALAAMIASASPATRLVVLNACYSVSIVEALRHKVDCVVGMDGAISDDAARSFAIAFYRALGHRCSVGNAVAQARAALDAKQQLDVPPICKTRDDVVADEVFLSASGVPRWDPPAPPTAPPDIQTQPDTKTQSSTVTQPDTKTPDTKTQSSTVTQPDTKAQSSTVPQPNTIAQLGTVPQPDTQTQPDTATQPDTTTQTSTATPPDTANRPKSDLRDSPVTPPPPVSSLPADSERYDLFLAYPPANKASARALYDLLRPDVRVFLDDRSLQSSAHRSQATLAAHRTARATVLLISQRADAAWYLGEQVVTAIALYRASPQLHRLIPVLLDPDIIVPYRLSHVPAIDMIAAGGVDGVAARLCAQIAAMRGQPAPALAAPIEPVLMRSGTNRCDHFRLHDRLGQLTDPLFEQIVVDAGVERSTIAPRTAAFSERVLDVAQLAALDSTLCRRILAELDRRASWTRS